MLCCFRSGRFFSREGLEVSPADDSGRVRWKELNLDAAALKKVACCSVMQVLGLQGENSFARTRRSGRSAELLFETVQNGQRKRAKKNAKKPRELKCSPSLGKRCRQSRVPSDTATFLPACWRNANSR